VSGASATAVGAGRSLRRWPAAEVESRHGTRSSERRDSVILRLVAFAALAAFAAMQWVALVADPPIGRAAVAVLAAIAGAGALASIARARIGLAPAWALALVASLLAVAAAALAIGVPARLLAPGRWGELGHSLTGGLNAIGNNDYPYSGANEWSRLAILFGLPLSLGLAATLAFWPRRRAAPGPRIPALVILVAAYATAATVNPPGAPLLHGLLLLVLVAAWLWLPGLGHREALVGGALVLAAGVIAMPLAARLDGRHPWFDYRNWDWAWSTVAGGESFSWDHSYGPLDWPRDGKTLLEVKSDAPHYWRTALLDGFDGFRWLQSGQGSGADVELPQQAARSGAYPDLSGLNHDWLHRITFTVHSLGSQLVVGAGTVLSVQGIRGITFTSSGLVLPADDPLTEGDSYTVRSYVPERTADQMAASQRRYPAALARYTTIDLPNQGSLQVPLRGGTRPSAAPVDGGARSAAATSRLLSGSPYRDVYGLAQRLTRRAPTNYGAVKAVEDYLRRNYTYSEAPPQHRYPLRAFLLKDGRGYCQQFSGAMALMLRMAGIPSRVAAGFSAGTRSQHTRTYTVRDFDAHSWVEVYFNGIGWVPFDPTPAVAPAQSQASGLGLLRFPAVTASGKPLPKHGGSSRSHRAKVGRPGATDSPAAIPLWVLPVGLGLLLTCTGIAVAARAARYRSLSPAAAAEARLRELESALTRLRSWTAGGTTLLALERRLGSVAGPAAAGYAAKLRAARYGPRDPGQPTAAERRAMRRELTSGLGLRARLRGLLAIPPGGPSTV
jgi:protein-glutamine gamma-glutamyltransferase